MSVSWPTRLLARPYFKGDLYLETGLHRALRAALQGRTAIHARILEVTEDGTPRLAPAPPAS